MHTINKQFYLLHTYDLCISYKLHYQAIKYNKEVIRKKGWQNSWISPPLRSVLLTPVLLWTVPRWLLEWPPKAWLPTLSGEICLLPQVLRLVPANCLWILLRHHSCCCQLGLVGRFVFDHSLKRLRRRECEYIIFGHKICTNF